MVPVNSKAWVNGCLVDAGKGEPIVEERGVKPWEVGRVLRIKCWFRRGTWKMAEPRGVWSHLGEFERQQGHLSSRNED